jgi:methylated-DNA-[protein]-cysteine S-methyltransferase
MSVFIESRSNHKYLSPLGTLKIHSDGKAITSILFLEDDKFETYQLPSNEVIVECIKQLNEYFTGFRKEFSVPLNPSGTEFQHKVWGQVTQIPYGETLSYGAIASAMGDPKLNRAVGMANGTNPIPIIIPCHRVIGSDGSLTGYAGGLDRKRWLLNHEQSNHELSKGQLKLF